MNFNWMPIGKAGKWTDRNNQTVVIDESYLDEVVNSTNPEDVKFVIEHPRYNKIGFGKISQLKRVGDILFALPKEVNSEFKDAVNKGDLPGRSMSIQRTSKKLLDISFLPPEIEPAIDGLGSYTFSKNPADDSLEVIMTAQFSKEENHFAEIENDKVQFASEVRISSYPYRLLKDTLRNLKDLLIEKFGLESADKVISNFTIDELGDPPRVYTIDTTENNFQKNNTEDKMENTKIDLSKLDPAIKGIIDNLQTKLDEKKIELQKAQATITSTEKEKITAEVLQFCSSEKIAKKILPAKKDKTVMLLTSLKENGKLEFSTADDKKETFDAYEFAKELIEMLPDAINTEEFAKHVNTGDEALTEAQAAGKRIAGYVK